MLEETASPSSSRPLPRVVLLIALLLLARGITDLCNYILGLVIQNHLMLHSSVSNGLIRFLDYLSPWNHLFESLMPLLIALAMIVISIAVLARTHWSIGGLLVLLVVIVLYQLIIQIVAHHILSLPSMLSIAIFSVLGNIINVVAVLAGYIAMLYYLAITLGNDVWKRMNFKEILPRPNSKVSLEISLIALLLLFSAVNDILVTGLQLPSLWLNSGLSQLPRIIYIAIVISIVSTIGSGVLYLFSSIGLWQNKHWSYIFTVIALLLGIAFSLISEIIGFIQASHQLVDDAFLRSSTLLGSIFSLLPFLLRGGVMIYFIRTAGRQEQPPAPFTTEPAPETPAE